MIPNDYVLSLKEGRCHCVLAGFIYTHVERGVNLYIGSMRSQLIGVVYTHRDS